MGLAMACPLFLLMNAGFLALFLGYGFPHVLAGSVQGGNKTDRLALLAFKSAITSDPFGALNSWNESVHVCQWFGVTCGRRHKRVTRLQLGHQKLTGSISSHVANLSFLQDLRLVNNSLSGKLPPELGRLRRLKVFTVLNNSITGEIPANMSGCFKLSALEFTGNRLVGKIPAELGSLAKLTELLFARNNLTGEVPSTFGNLSSLVKFYATENSISGSIPYSLGRLRNLEIFAVAGNQLIGTILPQMFNLSSINAIDVSNNQIQGSLPSNIGCTLTNVNFLGVAGNLFTGSIPISLSNATKLSFLVLTNNKFTGKVPHLGKLNGLEELLCHDNHLGTRQKDDLSFFDSMINATNLQAVDLGINQFGGLLPESICNFSTSVSRLIGHTNEIGGNIPTCVGNLINLEVFDFSNNHLREYGMGNEVSTCGDVYSYGILLLEMFTGKRPTDSMFTGGLSLHNFAKMAFLEQVANIVDPLLFRQWDMGEASSSLNNSTTQNSSSSQKSHECLVSLLKVGIACSQELPKDRMDISDVVSQLHAIRKSLLDVGDH